MPGRDPVGPPGPLFLPPTSSRLPTVVFVLSKVENSPVMAQLESHPNTRLLRCFGTVDPNPALVRVWARRGAATRQGDSSSKRCVGELAREWRDGAFVLELYKTWLTTPSRPSPGESAPDEASASPDNLGSPLYRDTSLESWCHPPSPCGGMFRTVCRRAMHTCFRKVVGRSSVTHHVYSRQISVRPAWDGPSQPFGSEA